MLPHYSQILVMGADRAVQGLVVVRGAVVEQELPYLRLMDLMRLRNSVWVSCRRFSEANGPDKVDAQNYIEGDSLRLMDLIRLMHRITLEEIL